MTRYLVELTADFNAIEDNGYIKNRVILYSDFNVINYLYESNFHKPEEICLYPDSTTVYLTLKYFYRIKIGKIVSTDLQNSILQFADTRSFSVFFFGDSSNILIELAKNLNLKYPNLKIVGTFSGYNYSTDAVIEIINQKNPDILFIGLGVSRQEKWICNNHEKLNAKLILSVGGWFQYLAHSKKRAPFVLRKLSLEWLYKLITDYKRVYLRYLVGVPKFFYRIFTNKIILKI